MATASSCSGRVDQSISLAEDLIQRCYRQHHIKGHGKLARKIQAELKFLKTLKSKDEKGIEMHLNSSNLIHLEAVVKALETLPGVCSVNKSFHLNGAKADICVDVVCNQGYTWTKVVARKPKALYVTWAGGGQFGERSIVEQALQYYECAQRHTKNFRVPQIVFIFVQGITVQLKEAIEKAGVLVQGEVVELEPEAMLDPNSSKSDDELLNSDKRRGFEKQEEQYSRELFNSDDSSGSDTELLSASEMFSKLKIKQDKPLTKRTANYDKEAIAAGQAARLWNSGKYGNKSSSVQSGSVTIAFEDRATSSLTADSHLCDDNALVDSNQGASTLLQNTHENSQSAETTGEGCHKADKTDVISGVTMHEQRDTAKRGDKKNSPASNGEDDGYIATSQGHLECLASLNTASGDPSFDGERVCNAAITRQPLSACVKKTPPQNSNITSTIPSNVITTSCDDGQSTDDPSDEGYDIREKMAVIDNKDGFPGSNQFVFYHEPVIWKLNLDITTLISYVSNVTHGFCHYVFQEAILSQQAAEEREKPLLPELDKLFQGKQLLTCETALQDFKSILETVGGPSEKARAQEFLARIHVVPDLPSERVQSLKPSAKIKARAKVIFGTGDALRLMTVTANPGFVRAARQQGLELAVYLHSPRILLEQKQQRHAPLKHLDN